MKEISNRYPFKKFGNLLNLQAVTKIKNFKKIIKKYI